MAFPFDFPAGASPTGVPAGVFDTIPGMPPRGSPEYQMMLARILAAAPYGLSGTERMGAQPGGPFSSQPGPRPAPMPMELFALDNMQRVNPNLTPPARAMIPGPLPPNAAGPAGSAGAPFGGGMQPMPFGAPLARPMVGRELPPNMAGPDRGPSGAPAVDPSALGMLYRSGVFPPATPRAAVPPTSAPPPPNVTANTAQVAGAAPSQPTPEQARQQQIEAWRRIATSPGMYGMLAPYLPGLQAPTSY